MEWKMIIEIAVYVVLGLGLIVAIVMFIKAICDVIKGVRIAKQVDRFFMEHKPERLSLSIRTGRVLHIETIRTVSDVKRATHGSVFWALALLVLC